MTVVISSLGAGRATAAPRMAAKVVKSFMVNGGVLGRGFDESERVRLTERKQVGGEKEKGYMG